MKTICLIKKNRKQHLVVINLSGLLKHRGSQYYSLANNSLISQYLPYFKGEREN